MTDAIPSAAKNCGAGGGSHDACAPRLDRPGIGEKSRLILGAGRSESVPRRSGRVPPLPRTIPRAQSGPLCGLPFGSVFRGSSDACRDDLAS